MDSVALVEKHGSMFLKTHCVRKHGKDHIYYSLCESLRVSRKRVVQRQVLHLGELNANQVESWQRTIQVIEEDGRQRQLRLFVDRPGTKVPQANDVAQVILSSLSLRNARRFGDCWIGCRLWEELGLREFWDELLSAERGEVAWEKVLELLAVNRLLDPRSELYVHEKWYAQTAMEFLLGTNAQVAEKDRLYRTLDRIVPHKTALEQHLRRRWENMFGAKFDVLLYDLTSTYFEGEAKTIGRAKRGYSRDHRPDCKQIVIALIVSREGFPLTYEIFDGNRSDVTTLEDILTAVEKRHGHAERVWVFDRGIVSEANLELLRRRGGKYLVGTPRNALHAREQQLLEKDWHRISEEVSVKLLPETEDTYVLARSTARAKKESAMRWRAIEGLMRDLLRLRRALRNKTLTEPAKLAHRIGRLHERYPQVWKFITIQNNALVLRWTWDREKMHIADARDGAYLLRTNLTATDPAELWRQYIQLSEVEAAFRTMKSEIAIRPIWHWTDRRVEAHVMIAFLGYCLWVCLKHKLRPHGHALTPWQALEHFKQIQIIEVWFRLKAGGAICLERITEPTPVQALLLAALGWSLPPQPPPKVYQDDTRLCGQPCH